MKSAKRPFNPQAFLAKVGTGKTIQKYRKNRIIYAQGAEADHIFYIQSGKVKVTVVSEQGKEAVVGLLEAGQFFGEGMSEWSDAPHRDRESPGRMPDHFNKPEGHAGNAAQGTELR